MTNPFKKWEPQIRSAIAKYAGDANVEERRDLHQEVLLALVRYGQERIEALDASSEDRARAEVFIVARNAISAACRKERRGGRTESLSTPKIAQESERAGLSSGKNIWQSVLTESAIQSLDEGEQNVIRGLFFEGLTETQLAEKMNVKRWYVRQQKKFALAALKRLLTN